MTKPEFDFRELIKRDREEHIRKQFDGTFLDYLQIVKSNPEVAMLSHQRLYELISCKGVEAVKTDRKSVV